MATILGEEWRRITFPSDEEDSESDLPRDADIQLEQSRAPDVAANSSVGTDEEGGGGVTSTTNNGGVTSTTNNGGVTSTTNANNDLKSGHSLPDAQAENNVSFPETKLMNDTFAGGTHNATKHLPANKKRTRKSFAEDSEDPSSVNSASEKKLKMTNNNNISENVNEPNTDATVKTTQKEKEKESVCEEFKHSVRTCRVSIHPIHLHSWYNPCINPAWLHTELTQIHKTKVKEAAEVISDLKENLQDKAGTIDDMKENINKKEDNIADLKKLNEAQMEKNEMQAEKIAQMEELNEDQRENLAKKENTISELQEVNTDLRDNRDGLAEELQLLKRQMEVDKEKYIKELQDMSAKVDKEKVDMEKYIKELQDMSEKLTCKEVLLERTDQIIEGMMPMFKALEAVKTDHKKGV